MDTQKIQAVHAKARDAAEYWLVNFSQVPHDVPYRIRNRWVRVTIRYDTDREATSALGAVREAREATKPLEER